MMGRLRFAGLNSAPPRLRLLIPALAITAAMLIVFMAGVASLLVCGLVASILAGFRYPF
jgi:hypothetical protein